METRRTRKVISKVILDHDIEAIVDVAGNQVLPWKEFLLPKIAKAVTDAAVAVGKERGKPLRAWLVSGINILRYPGTPEPYLLQDYIPRPAYAQHEATRQVVESVPLSDLRWSLICVALMEQRDPNQGIFEPLDAPKHHNLVLKASSPPSWEDTWVMWILLIGVFLNLWVVLFGQYTTTYEDVADFLSEDLESGSEEWVGKRVGMKDKAKIKTA